MFYQSGSYKKRLQKQYDKLLYIVIFILTVHVQANAQTVIFGDTAQKRQGSFFPLMRGLKEKAVKAGAIFPKPYGVAASMYYQQQQMEITKIKIGSIEISEENGIVDFDDSKIKNTVISSQVRGDLWILPFVNMYAMLGRVNTFNDIDLKINLNAPPGSPNPGDINLLSQNAIANVNGTVVGMGTVIAGGYGKVFANVNLTWAKVWLNEVNSTQRSFVAFPMIGLTTNFANLFVGGIFQNTGETNKGSFIGVNNQPVSYELAFSSRRWNYTFGLNKSIGNWSFIVVQGVGARTNSVVEVGYRFGN